MLKYGLFALDPCCQAKYTGYDRQMLKTLDQFDYHHRIENDPGIALVVFSSPDCGSCRHLEGVLMALSHSKPEWQIYKVDVQQDMALAREFELFHLPSLFLYNNGIFHAEISSQATLNAIIVATENALTKPAEEAP